MRFNRLTLKRSDGQVYLDRWGIESKRIGGIFLHRMTAPDPGVDLHTHPWVFCSLILRGGYDEERTSTRLAQGTAKWALDALPTVLRRGHLTIRNPWRVRYLGLNECHRITHLHDKTSWSLVVHGPWRQQWGFWTPNGFVDEESYSAERRDMIGMRG